MAGLGRDRRRHGRGRMAEHRSGIAEAEIVIAMAVDVSQRGALGLKVVPWTVNAREDLADIIDMKVDGLITDYPDRAREVMAEKGVPLP